MDSKEIRAYAAEHEISLREAWRDFADAYGWDPEDNPFGYPADADLDSRDEWDSSRFREREGEAV